MNQRRLAGSVVLSRALLIGWPVLLFPGWLRASDLPPIQLRLYVAPGVDASAVHRAQPIARTIFERAGIQLEWRDCTAGSSDAACIMPLGPTEFVLRVLPVRADGDSHACGVSIRPRHGVGGRLITLYARCMRDFADRLYLDPPVIIAYTLAHEIGHLFLPDDRHGFSGVMRGSLAQANAAEWRHVARGDLQFGEAELTMIKEALASQAGRRD